MEILLGVLLILTVVATFFTIPYSKTKNTFNKVSEHQALLAGQPDATFELADITGLPLPVQKYFTHCGFLETPRMQIMKAVYKNVNFKFGKNKPALKIDYVQHNYVNEPARIAYIDSSIYGLPFEGLDSFIAGKGSMTGIIAKLFTLFSQTGEAIDEANLLVPVWLHFLFNFLSTIHVGSMVNLVTWYAVLYTAMALGFFFWHKRFGGLI